MTSLEKIYEREAAAKSLLSEILDPHQYGGHEIAVVMDAFERAEQAVRAKDAEMARGMAEGWRENHCEHCMEGAMALSNFAFDLDRLGDQS